MPTTSSAKMPAGYTKPPEVVLEVEEKYESKVGELQGKVEELKERLEHMTSAHAFFGDMAVRKGMKHHDDLSDKLAGTMDNTDSLIERHAALQAKHEGLEGLAVRLHTSIELTNRNTILKAQIGSTRSEILRKEGQIKKLRREMQGHMMKKCAEKIAGHERLSDMGSRLQSGDLDMQDILNLIGTQRLARREVISHRSNFAQQKERLASETQRNHQLKLQGKRLQSSIEGLRHLHTDQSEVAAQLRKRYNAETSTIHELGDAGYVMPGHSTDDLRRSLQTKDGHIVELREAIVALLQQVGEAEETQKQLDKEEEARQAKITLAHGKMRGSIHALGLGKKPAAAQQNSEARLRSQASQRKAQALVDDVTSLLAQIRPGSRRQPADASYGPSE